MSVLNFPTSPSQTKKTEPGAVGLQWTVRVSGLWARLEEDLSGPKLFLSPYRLVLHHDIKLALNVMIGAKAAGLPAVLYELCAIATES